MRDRLLTGAVCLVVLALAAAALVGGGPPAFADEPFRITYTQEQQAGRPTVIKGSVHNEARLDAHDVYVTAEAQNAGGKVIARGISYVAATIPVGRSADFTAKVPAIAGVARVNVTVSSYRLGLASQSP